MVLTSFFVILILLNVFKEICAQCQFPDFLQSNGNLWVADYPDSKYAATVEGSVVRASMCRGDACVKYDRLCVRAYGEERYLVEQREDHQLVQYLCVQFIARGASVIQLKMSNLKSTPSAKLCMYENLELDHWPLVNIEQFYSHTVPCPIHGGYDISLNLSNGQSHCADAMLPLRLESGCIQSDTIEFRFRTKRCVLPEWQLEETQRMYCMATWSTYRDTFVVLRGANRYKFWCMRIHVVRRYVEHIYLFLSAVCDPHYDIKLTDHYIYMKVQSRIIPSVCTNEFRDCSIFKLFCNSDLRPHCQKSCGDCRFDKEYTPCSFSPSIRGRWIRSFVSGNSVVVISQNRVTIGNSRALTCILLNSSYIQHRHVLLETFDNGCYPRYTCMDVDHPAPSILRYRFGESVVWPIDLSGDPGQFICDESRFTIRTRNHRLHSTHLRTPKESLIRQGTDHHVSCNLPYELGNAIPIRHENGLYGCITNDQKYTPYKLTMTYFTDADNSDATFTEYLCLGSMKFIGNYDTIITRTVNKEDEYFCWIFTHDKILQLSASICDQITADAILMKIRRPIAQLAILRNKTICDAFEDRKVVVHMAKSEVSSEGVQICHPLYVILITMILFQMNICM